MTRSPARLRGALAALLLALVATGTGAAPAAAATTVSGPTTFTFTGSAFQKHKIDVAASGGKRETEGTTRHVVATQSVAFGKKTTKVRHKGIVSFSHKAGGKTRKIVVSGIELRLKSKRSEVWAKVGGKRMTFLEFDLRKREYTADSKAGVVKIDVAAGKLTKQAASAIRKKLRLRSLARGSFAVIGTTASRGGQSSAPAPTAPALAPAPPGATGVTDLAPLRWHVRESFIRYVASGEGTTATNGAVPGAPAAGGVIYDYDFTPDTGSWFDPATGRGVFRYKGTLVFSYTGHGIYASLTNPEVRIDRAGSVMVADVAGSGEPTATRRTFATVVLAADSTAGTAAPRYAYSNLLVEVTEAMNTAVFSGFYPPDDNDFGTLAFSFNYVAG